MLTSDIDEDDPLRTAVVRKVLTEIQSGQEWIGFGAQACHVTIDQVQMTS
jgi:hypothetical protein